MRKIDELLAEYGESHQNATNKMIHWICVPLIFFSVVGLIGSIPSQFLVSVFGQGSWFANWATILLCVTLLYYITLSVPLALGMFLFGTFCLFVMRQLLAIDVAPLWAISISIFVLAWIGQFYGHKVEGKKPSFFKDVQFLMIGPAWLMHFIYKKIGIPY